MSAIATPFFGIVLREYGEVGRPWAMVVSLKLCEDRRSGRYYLRFRNAGLGGLQYHFVDEANFAALADAVDHAIDVASIASNHVPVSRLRSIVGGKKVVDYGWVGDFWVGFSEMSTSLRLRFNRRGYLLRFRTVSRLRGLPVVSWTWFTVHEGHFAKLQAAVHDAMAIAAEI